MSVPVVESIAVDIETKINLITEANGFNQDLTAQRSRRVDFVDVAPADGLVLIWQGTEQRPEDEVISVDEWIQPFILYAIVMDSDDAVTSIDTRLNQVRADIQKKLLEDTTRNSNAIETIIGASDRFDDGQGFTGIAVPVLVHYRTVFGDPYTKAN